MLLRLSPSEEGEITAAQETLGGFVGRCERLALSSLQKMSRSASVHARSFRATTAASQEVISDMPPTLCSFTLHRVDRSSHRQTDWVWLSVTWLSGAAMTWMGPIILRQRDGAVFGAFLHEG